MEMPKAGAEKCEEQTGAADRLQTPIPHPPMLPSGEKVEELGVKGWSWAWEEGGVGGWKVAYVLSLFLNTQPDFNLE